MYWGLGRGTEVSKRGRGGEGKRKGEPQAIYGPGVKGQCWCVQLNSSTDSQDALYSTKFPQYNHLFTNLLLFVPRNLLITK